jgi:NO-binding membrane sensor protein with MHYT domain
MGAGLILLAFLACLVALFAVRMRRRMGLASSGKHWVILIAGFVIIVLGLWASSQR